MMSATGLASFPLGADLVLLLILISLVLIPVLHIMLASEQVRKGV